MSLSTAKTYQDASATAKSANIWDTLEENRFGAVALILVVMSCLGGGAAAIAVGAGIAQLMAVAITTMAIEVLIMAVAPIKYIVYVSIVALVIDLLMFAIWF